MSYSINVKNMLNAAEAEFARTYGGKPSAAAFAPGRVNIIGEHTDYNEGFVMPMVCAWIIALYRLFISCNFT